MSHPKSPSGLGWVDPLLSPTSPESESSLNTFFFLCHKHSLSLPSTHPLTSEEALADILCEGLMTDTA